MNDDYHERGFLKQLVLLAFMAYAWCEEKADQLVDYLRDAEWFWWTLCVLFTIVAWLCLMSVVVK